MTDNPMMTQYSADEVVPKWDPRIARRGALDALMAEAELLDMNLCSYYTGDKHDPLSSAIYRCRVFIDWCQDVDTGADAVPGIQDRRMRPLDELHGKAHVVAACTYFNGRPQSRLVAQLNVFRAHIRQAELLFCYEGATAADQWIQYVLNRLSSAVYVAMWEVVDR